MFISHCNFCLCNFGSWLWVLGTVDARRIFGTHLCTWVASKTTTHRSDWEPCKYIWLNSNISVLSSWLPLSCTPNMLMATPTSSDTGGSTLERELEWKEYGVNQLVLKFLAVANFTKIWDQVNTLQGPFPGLCKGTCKWGPWNLNFLIFRIKSSSACTGNFLPHHFPGRLGHCCRSSHSHFYLTVAKLCWNKGLLHETADYLSFSLCLEDPSLNILELSRIYGF